MAPLEGLFSINKKMPIKKYSWINDNWRPLTAITYITLTIFDFIIFPILWSILQLIGEGQVSTAWSPLTLQGGALIHISFGAFLGIYSHGRSKEKLSQLEK